MRRKYSIIILLLLAFLNVKATHIVGGDFNYKYLGEDSFQITLKLYVDCENGNPAAIAMDDEAIIGIFDAEDNSLIDTFIMVREAPIRLNKVLYDCVIPEKGVCVDGYTYQRNMKIDQGDKGVILAFQRCCRNHSLSNIIDPGGTGATYWTKITGKKTATVNSNPLFKELPPNYLCTTRKLVFDHSAIDHDGDSLVYELYQPFTGATANAPRPLQPSNPPFQPVVWKSGYSTSNQMKGSPILMIDKHSGELTVTPTNVGQFVIGVKVKEYRNGLLIGETLRDYQFNVRQCQFDITADFNTPQAGEPKPSYYCNDSVYFFDKSFNAIKYKWDFGDPSTNKDTSSQLNPTWVYPGDGDYIAKLHVLNEGCEDSIEIKVKIRENIDVSLGADQILCDSTTASLSLKNTNATKIEWSTGESGLSIDGLNEGQYFVDVFYGQCKGSDTANIISKSVQFSLSEDTILCGLVDIVLDADIEGPDIEYQWSTGINDQSKTKRVFEAGEYIVRVFNSFCEHTDTIKIGLSELPNSNLLATYPRCDHEPIVLDVGTSGEDYHYIWDPEYEDQAIIQVEDPGIYTVKVVNKHGCFVLDTAEVYSVESENDFFIPNVFTPNSDPLNDHYFIDFSGFKIDYFHIYNRWGEKVYEAKGKNVDWDGNTKSGIAPEGVYYIIAKIEDPCREPRKVHGFITLIR